MASEKTKKKKAQGRTGRPPEPDTRKMPLGTKLSQYILEYLRQHEDGIAPTIENAISKTSDFKAWFQEHYEWEEK